jgi:hypothetical protein
LVAVALDSKTVSAKKMGEKGNPPIEISSEKRILHCKTCTGKTDHCGRAMEACGGVPL